MTVEKFITNLDQVVLQVTWVDPSDGSQKTDVTWTKVRVFRATAGGETEYLPLTNLVQIGATSTWRYIWLTPPITVAGSYIAEYTAEDADGDMGILTEDIIIKEDQDPTILARLDALEAKVDALELKIDAQTLDITDVLDAELGRQKLTTDNVWIMYRRDNITVLKEFDVKDDAGNPSHEDVFERVPKP